METAKASNVIEHLLLMGTAGALLYHFIMIKRHGQFIIHEPSPAVLGLEIALLSGIVLFGFSQLVREK